MSAPFPFTITHDPLIIQSIGYKTCFLYVLIFKKEDNFIRLQFLRSRGRGDHSYKEQWQTDMTMTLPIESVMRVPADTICSEEACNALHTCFIVHGSQGQEENLSLALLTSAVAEKS